MHGLTQQDKQMVAVTRNYSPSIFPRRLAFMVLNIPFLFFLPHTSIDLEVFGVSPSLMYSLFYSNM